eukprot:gene2719-3138_t
MTANAVNTPKSAALEELTSEQQKEINQYAQKGNDEMDNANYVHAIDWFSKALEIVPEPKDKWEATGWLTASIGDAYFSLMDYEEGAGNLQRSYQIYGPEEANPFILLRLGQCYFHLGNEQKAKEYLLAAYMLEGKELFEDEQLYFDFLQSKVLL